MTNQAMCGRALPGARLALTLIVMCGLVPWSLPASAAPASRASQPASMATTSAPAGKWRCYMRSDDPAIVAAGRDNIWFRCGAGFWRYDVKSQSTTQLGPLEGVVVEPGAAGALAADGRFAIADRRQGCMWTPGKGPAALPSPPGATSVQSLQFDDKDTPWAFTSSEAYRWDGAWRLAGTAPTHQTVARLGRTWLMFNGALGPRPYGPLFIADDKFGDIRPHPAKTSELLRNFIPAGGRLFGVFGQTDPTLGQAVLTEITPTEMIQQIEGDAVGVDVEGKVFLKLTVVSRTDAGRLCQVETSDGVKPAPLLVPNVGWEFRPTLLRDTNGHIWVNNFRWDGRSWKAIAPPRAFVWRPLALALGDRLELDPSTMQWRPAGGDATELANDSYDPKSRTAWIAFPKDSGATLQRVRFSKDAPAVLQSIDLSDTPESSPFQVGDQWWWSSRKNAYRLDADGKVHAYSATMSAPGAGEEVMPVLALSPRGTVWLWHVERYWGRYDPENDHFVKGFPYDDFSFQLGAWTLSAVPPVAGERGRRLWRKDKDRWETLANPFGQGDLYVAGRYLRDGRLLVTCWQGAFEYDAKTDNWVCLHDGRELVAGFDAAGRRIMCTPDAVGLLYVYEGDPLSAGPGVDKALAARFAELLALMDDPSWQVRTKATQEVQEMGDQATGLLKSALKRTDLPAEVRDRLEPILKGLGTEEKLSQKNLFTRMHPPLMPGKGD